MINWDKLFRKGGTTIPRWAIFAIDVAISAGSILLSYLLISDLHGGGISRSIAGNALFIILFFRILSFIILRTYAGIIRYTGAQDAVRIAVAIFSSSFLTFVVNITYFYFSRQSQSLIPASLIIVDFFITVVAMTSLRLGYKLLFQQVKNASIEKIKTIIYGAGQFGIITKRTLDHDTSSRFKVVAFLDNDKSKIGKMVDGVKIYNGEEELEKMLEKGSIDQVIISIQDISNNRKRSIIETCLNYKVKVLNIPPVNKWINGELSFNQIKNVKIEDLLGRDEIEIENALVSQNLRGKVILVTGAAGSIGAEICRQIMLLNPRLLVMVDQGETPLYEIEFEFRNTLKYENIRNAEFIVGDIRNERTMRAIFDKFRPDKVFHAAAYKHVPLMEANPCEAIKNNIMGTRILADLSVEFGVSKFVMVSTDKAVNPTNVMGASKRIAEIYVQSLNNSLMNKGGDYTRFITTRFGNVLGSNGSVIPVFRRQIENGGPITVTHPEITRYFMTIPEACSLVLEAGAMGKGGEIYVFDMGEPVKIVDLATKMIRLSGLEPGKDIQIQYTGLRPGEKIYEELLNDSENTLPTHFSKIMIGKVRQYDYELASDQINNIIISSMGGKAMEVVRLMKEMVPEYVSQNYTFQTLDTTKKQETHSTL